MSHKSLQKTITNRKFKPVLVKWFKRIFNVDLDPKSSKNTDVLNIAKDKSKFFNWILIEIDEKELKKLKKREKHYIFEKIEAKDMYSDKIYSNCIVAIDYNTDIDYGLKKPKEDYFRLCREAAYHLSQDFWKIFDETTFTSKNESIKDFLSKDPNY